MSCQRGLARVACDGPYAGEQVHRDPFADGWPPAAASPPSASQATPRGSAKCPAHTGSAVHLGAGTAASDGRRDDRGSEDGFPCSISSTWKSSSRWRSCAASIGRRGHPTPPSWSRRGSYGLRIAYLLDCARSLRLSRSHAQGEERVRMGRAAFHAVAGSALRGRAQLGIAENHH